jgi:uncharacterized protein (TIGR00266 family)
MKISLRHQPAYAIARVELDPNEQIQLESGALVAHSVGATLTSKMEGGFMKSLKRAVLSGDSFFMSTMTASPQGSWVDIAPGLPGDIITLPVAPEAPWMLMRSAWLASGTGVTIDSKWAGWGNLLGGEGGFAVLAQGQGDVLVNCYGALDVYDLDGTNSITIDSGHLVALQSTLTATLRKSASGWMNTIKSGEGFVFEISGTGRIYAQSRNPNWFDQFANATHSHGSR